jgi:hypothetical protein
VSTYPCLESPVGRPARPVVSTAPYAKVRTLLVSVLLTAMSARTARTRPRG